MRFAFDEPFDDSDEDRLEREFPLGDGVADVEADVACPYCGEIVTVALDPGSGDDQEYVGDCGVCCRPWRVLVQYDNTGSAHVSLVPVD